MRVESHQGDLFQRHPLTCPGGALTTMKAAAPMGGLLGGGQSQARPAPQG